MNFIKMLGIVTLVLGALVLLVAAYVSVQENELALNPLLLGAAAVLAGILSLKKSSQ